MQKKISLLKDIGYRVVFYIGCCLLLSRTFHIVIDSSSRGFSSNTQSSGMVEPLGNLRTFKLGNHLKNLHHFLSELSISDFFMCTFLYFVFFIHEASWFLRIDRFLWCPLVGNRRLFFFGRISLLFFVSLACSVRIEFVRVASRTLVDIGKFSGLFIDCCWFSSNEFLEPFMLPAIISDSPLASAILEP